MSETTIQTNIQLAIGTIKNVTMWRNNTAMGWAGRLIRKYQNGSVEIESARPLHAGLCEGSSDLIGITSVVITAEMVGKTVAVFTALEVKTATGTSSPEQKNFIRVVKEAGGIAEVVRSPYEAISALNKAL